MRALMGVRISVASWFAGALLLLAAPLGATAAESAGAQAYVQGRLALSDSQLDVASRRFDDALKAGETDGILRRRALEVAILAGDSATAFRLAAALNAEKRAGAAGLEAERPLSIGDSLIALTAMTAAASGRQWRLFDEERAGFVEPPPTATSTPVIGPVLEAYSLAARQAYDAALAKLDIAGARGAARSYLEEHRAHILGLAGRWPEAADAYSALVSGEGAAVPRLRIAAAASGLKAGRTEQRYRDRAIAILGGGPAEDPVLGAARARLSADPRMDGAKLGGLLKSPEEGVSLLFLRLAVDLGRERSGIPAITFARLATFLAPEMAESWLVAADTLARQDEPELALAALRQIRPDPVYLRQIESRRAAILASQEQWAEAKAILRKMTEQPDTGRDDWVRLADIERREGDFAASAASLTKAIALVPVGRAAELGQYHFLRGAAYEQGGQWDRAEPDLRRAVELQPDNPVFLNYLGYSMLDRRVRVEEASKHISRAFALAPDNGAIIDSMGWAAFVTGDYANAVRLLEMARAAEPADAAVADHLGDALWKAGRRIEARHAWASALALEPDAKLAASLGRKLDFGLDVALAKR